MPIPVIVALNDRSSIKRWATVLSVVVAVVAAVLVFDLSAASQQRIGPVDMAIDLSMDLDGQTALAFPPFGSLVADTHAGPIAATATLAEVDVARVQAIASNGTPTTEEIEVWVGDVRSGVISAGLRGIVAALIAAALVGWAFTRSLRPTLVSAAVALALIGGSLGIGAASFDAAAFIAPEYQGILKYAPAALGLVQDRLANVESLQRQVRSLASDLADYYGVPQSLVSGGSLEGTYRVLHVSDLHLDPIGMQLVLDLASAYDVELIIDTGDITHFGTDQEGALAVEQMGGRPYVFIPGNHDSPEIVSAITDSGRATVLSDETTTTARGLVVLGIGDPTSSGSDVEPDSTRAAEHGLAVAEERARERFDIVAVHDPASGQPFEGRATVVLSGHSHTPSLTVREGTVFLGAGTTGGVHFTELRPDPHIPHGAAMLYFSQTEPGRLVAIDQIEVYGKSRQSSIRRTIVDEEFVRGE